VYAIVGDNILTYTHLLNIASNGLDVLVKFPDQVGGAGGSMYEV
jgi:hypothetical protein